MDNVNLKKFQIKECSVELEQMDPKLMEKYVKATNVKGKLIFVQKMCKILEFFGKTWSENNFLYFVFITANQKQVANQH